MFALMQDMELCYVGRALAINSSMVTYLVWQAHEEDAGHQGPLL